MKGTVWKDTDSQTDLRGFSDAHLHFIDVTIRGYLDVRVPSLLLVTDEL